MTKDFSKKYSEKQADSEWFSRFTKIASFQMYEYFKGNFHSREKQKGLFLAKKIQNPKLDYPLLSIQDLRKKEIELKKLLRDILKSEKNVLIREAYQKKIDEKLTEICALKASLSKGWGAFSSLCKKLYGFPSLMAQGHTASWLKKQIQKAKEKKFRGISDGDIASLELFVENWLRHIPSRYRLIRKPSQSLFKKTRTNFLKEFRNILKLTKRRNSQFDASEICKIFNKAIQSAGLSEWKATIIKSNSISINTNLTSKQIQIPHRKRLCLSDLRALIVHEIGTHATRQAKGEKSGFALLGLGLDNYEQSEEGIATFREQLARGRFTDFFGFPSFLSVCLAVGCDGKKRNFRETYEISKIIFFLLKKIDGEKTADAKQGAEQEAWERTVRTFRGTDCIIPGICFTKDLIYREGNIKIWEAAEKGAVDIKNFNIGKYNPLNPKHIEIIDLLGITGNPLPRNQTRKKLIINADDYGISREFNKGILELISKGIVKSVSVLINKKNVRSNDFKGENISIGLHLDISDGSDRKKTRREISRQIKKFESLFGKLPSHLDGHKNCHLLPNIFLEILRAAKRHDLPVRSTNDKNRAAIRKTGLRTPSRLVWWNFEYKNALFSGLQKNFSGTTELLCHPGYFDPKSNLSYNKQRKEELDILKSSDFKNAIKKYQIISYCDL